MIAALLAFAGAPLARLGFHLDGPAGDDLGLAFALAGTGWLCQCLFAVFQSLFTARQDYRRIARDQHRRHGGDDDVDAAADPARAARLDLPRLSGPGLR